MTHLRPSDEIATHIGHIAAAATLVEHSTAIVAAILLGHERAIPVFTGQSFDQNRQACAALIASRRVWAEDHLNAHDVREYGGLLALLDATLKSTGELMRMRTSAVHAIWMPPADASDTRHSVLLKRWRSAQTTAWNPGDLAKLRDDLNSAEEEIEGIGDWLIGWHAPTAT